MPDELRQKLEIVRARIANAAAKAGRDPSAITLIAVTKIFPASAIREAYEIGVRDFDEGTSALGDGLVAHGACANKYGEVFRD